MNILEFMKNKLKNFIFISKDNNDCQKEIISNINKIKDDIKNFLDISYGSIIWADRYNDDEERMRIPLGHRNGPYVVVGRNEDKLLCFYATGEEPKEGYLKNNVIILEPFFYRNSLGKKTYVSTNKVEAISEDRFISEVDKLTIFDRKCLNKKMDINLRLCLYYENTFENEYVPFEVSDIINLKGFLYLILEKKENEYKCIPLSSKNGEYNFTVGGKIYYYDLGTIVTFDNLDRAYRADFVSDDKIIKVIEVRRQRYLESLENQGKIMPGCLIENIENEDLYYVYGEEGEAWLIVKVYAESNDQMATFIIDKSEYCSDFKGNFKISKKDKDYVILAVASENEMDDFRKTKKTYIKTHSNKKEKAQRKYKLDSGVIVRMKNFEGREYVIIIGNQDDVVAVSKDKINENFYLEVLPISSIVKCGRMNQDDFRKLLGRIQDEYKGLISGERMKQLKKKYDV